MDTGTWPMDGGGVASCRELVLDYVEDINWKVNAEIGNDYKQVRILAYFDLNLAILPLQSQASLYFYAEHNELGPLIEQHLQLWPWHAPLFIVPLAGTAFILGADKIKLHPFAGKSVLCQPLFPQEGKSADYVGWAA